MPKPARMVAKRQNLRIMKSPGSIAHLRADRPASALESEKGMEFDPLVRKNSKMPSGSAGPAVSGLRYSDELALKMRMAMKLSGKSSALRRRMTEKLISKMLIEKRF